MSKTRKSKRQISASAGNQGGRPEGSAVIKRPVAVAVPARCPTCGNTKHHREPGARPIVHEIDGVSQTTGEPYRFVIWRKVICECGQHFRVREETNHDPRDSRS